MENTTNIAKETAEALKETFRILNIKAEDLDKEQMTEFCLIALEESIAKREELKNQYQSYPHKRAEFQKFILSIV